MLIRNFGRHWERKYISWGTGKNNRGHLRGYLRPRAKSVDFRDQTAIYVLYDKDLLPVYIGQAGIRNRHRLFDRLKDHDVDHLWNRWDHFSWFGLTPVRKGSLDLKSAGLKLKRSALLNQMESMLITALEPKLNKQGGRWERAEEYFQDTDSDADAVTIGDVVPRMEALERQLKSMRNVLSAQRVK